MWHWFQTAKSKLLKLVSRKGKSIWRNALLFGPADLSVSNKWERISMWCLEQENTLSTIQPR